MFQKCFAVHHMFILGGPKGHIMRLNLLEILLVEFHVHFGTPPVFLQNVSSKQRGDFLDLWVVCIPIPDINFPTATHLQVSTVP